MGSVYLAHDQDLDRDVAIKFISAQRAADPNARRRLIREARAAAALDHPNICAVHDVIVEPDGRACIVMQYVEGETLSARLQRGPLDPRQTFLLAADMAAALAAAHRRGIVHRDVKPQNIIITPAGKAKLLDFGIAHLDGPVATPGDSTTTSLTGLGRAAGTPLYMSPEQAQQQPLDGRSDLFSLGAVVYECLTGRKAFEAASDAEIYLRILQEHPPAVSAVREGMGEQVDELCRRLLAKHPDDRFASADELLGALRLLAPDTAHPSGTREAARPRWRLPTVNRRVAILGAIAIAAAIGGWAWLRPEPLPAPPEDAQRWYVRGTEAIRDGAYHSAKLALQQAIDLFQPYALAYARIAEAHGELDETDAAERALLTLDQLVVDRSRLAVADRLRVDAVRALIIGDMPAAVGAYEELTRRRAADAGAWLDLGRAQEAAARPADALASYDRAIAIDRHYAAAHLRRAFVLSLQGRRSDALAAFDEAERLYRAESNVEGETETLLRRGTFLLGAARLGDARAALERARTLAGTTGSRAQEIRARLRLGNLTAAEGRFAEAERLAGDAVDAALAHGLETVAADALIELGIVLLNARRNEQADAQLQRAAQLAEKHGAHRLLARARLQRASVLNDLKRPDEALALAERSVEFMRARGYRRYELIGLAIMSRANQRLHRYDQAHAIATQALQVAEQLGDTAQIGEALENLAGIATARGEFPSALGYRERLEQLHRSQKNVSLLAFDLTLRAELLLRLGRFDDADAVLREVDAGIGAGVEAYKARARRVSVVRALSATYRLRFDDAAAHASAALRTGPEQPDATANFAAALHRHAEARLGRRRPARDEPAAPPSGELLQWNAATRLAAGDPRSALAVLTAEIGNPAAIVSYETEWRLCAMAAAAARSAGNADDAARFAQRARQALRRLRESWKEHAGPYERRPDVLQLSREAGLNAQA